ncbi:hypothetical protein evm_004853 [Chilo suppressalis]|nr:hypothetical protein evm_004853 [Chilo suppressalis]
MQEVYNRVNDSKYAIGVLLDMTKAYDKVNYNILLNKLYGIGIRGKAHEWFKSYLKNREQFVEIEYFDTSTSEIKNIRSDRKIINASIPQGSVLGCLLFLIYINDLPATMAETLASCVLFADDISLLTSCQSYKNLNHQLNEIFNKINDWMCDHNLEINLSKTKLMSFYPYQKAPININFNFNGTTLEVVDEFCLLGITIDKHLNWKPHIQKVRSKIASFSYAFYEIKRTTNMKTALAMYYAYAYSWLNYGVILWGNSTDASIIFTQQKKLVRILVNIENTDSF